MVKKAAKYLGFLEIVTIGNKQTGARLDVGNARFARVSCLSCTISGGGFFKTMVARARGVIEVRGAAGLGAHLPGWITKEPPVQPITPLDRSRSRA